MINNIKILVMSCDKNVDLMHIYYQCMEKYWPDHPEIIYSTETLLNPYYKWIIKDYPLEQWTRRLKETLQEIDAEYVIVMADDIFLHRPVNSQQIYDLLKYFDNQTAAINLERSFDNNDKIIDDKICMRNLTGKYKASMMCQLWKKSKLIEIINRNTDPWKFELTSPPKNFNYLILNNHIIIDWGYYKQDGEKQWFGIHGGKWTQEAVKFLTKEDFNINYDIRGVSVL